MKKELNIAAILKDKPEGTKLWSPIFGDCTLDKITSEDPLISEQSLICVYTPEKVLETFYSNGKYDKHGECVIFPSKQMQDWSKFAWKKGDVLSCGVDNFCIFKKWENDEYTEFDAEFVTPDYSGAILKTKDWVNVTNENIVKQHISKVEEIKGGKLNLETLEIEQPKQEFKDGDIVAFGESVAIYKKFENDELYFYACIEAAWGLILSDSVNTSLEYRLATDSEKQQLFDTLTKEGKRWNPDVKTIEDLPKKCEFKPMDWCLMKDSTKYWELCQFAYTRKVNDTTMYSAVGGLIYYKCIPYNEETKHLLGTTDEWKGGK